jgi:hypothetical protein
MNIPVDRFDPAICRKAIRIAAAVCVMEFLTTIALLMTWVPAHSKCRAWSAPIGSPEPIYALMVPIGLLTLWTCILAIFWKHFAKLAFAQIRRREVRQRALPRWLRWPPFQLNYTALFIFGFVGFAAAVAIPLLIILKKCGP